MKMALSAAENQELLREQEMEDTFRIMDEMASGEFEQKFEEIVDHMETTYKEDDNDWCVMYSSGKDSSLVLSLVIKMLKRLSPFERTKKVHVISANTKVETKQMTEFLKRNLNFIKENTVGLNLHVHLVEPEMKNSFYFTVIGKGYPFPIPESPFQWCTSKMKIQPMDNTLKELLENISTDKNYKLTMLLGSRVDESASRAASINLYTREEEVMGTHKKFEDIRVYYPIKFIQTPDLWTYLSQLEDLGWGTTYEELFEHYSNGKECPMTQAGDEKNKACGASNSRNGCWVCLYAGRKDKMLQTLIDKGHDDAKYLSEWKAFLYDIRNDVRFREPLSRTEVKNIIKSDNTFQLDLFSDLELSEKELSFKHYKRADKSSYNPGGFTFECRLMLLQKLLYTQKMCGYELIPKEELDAVLRIWEEDGYSVTDEDLIPINHQLPGKLWLDEKGEVKLSETNIPHMAFTIDIKFDMDIDDICTYLRKRQQMTRKSYFCFLNYQEYPNFNYVNNVLTFIVSEPHIETKEEALDELGKFLFPETDDVEVIVENYQAANGKIKLDILEDLMFQYEDNPNSPQFEFLDIWLHNEKELTKKYMLKNNRH